MASSQSDNQDHHQQPKKESSQFSSNTNDPPPPPVPSPTTGYPPMMGYPPGPAQPGYPPPPPPGQPGIYHNYNAYNNNYPYTQAPPAAYYNSHMYQVQQETPVSAFLRGIIGGLMLIIIFMCISSILMWLIVRPAIPLIHLNTLSVSNFNGSPSLFTANWDVNITVENHNTKLKIYFDQIEVFMYYDTEDLLASTYARPFLLETQQNNVIETKLTANNSDNSRAGVGSWVVEKMVKDKSRSGKVKFGLRMAIWSTFKSGTWWSRDVNIRVYCEELVVAFVGNSGNGNLADSKGSDCLSFA